jgi:hypothetical protein
VAPPHFFIGLALGEHMILHALGVALFFALMWSALAFEGLPPE